MEIQSLKSQITTGFKELYGKLQDLAEQSDVAQSIREVNNGYLVFGIYSIQRTARGQWCVSHSSRITTAEVNSLANALFYCMADYGGNRDLAKTIVKLDQQYHQKQFDIQNKIYLLKTHHSMNTAARSVLLIKLDEDLKQSRRLKNEIRKYTNQAKYIKIKGSYYEFTRTSANC